MATRIIQLLNYLGRRPMKISKEEGYCKSKISYYNCKKKNTENPHDSRKVLSPPIQDFPISLFPEQKDVVFQISMLNFRIRRFQTFPFLYFPGRFSGIRGIHNNVTEPQFMHAPCGYFWCTIIQNCDYIHFPKREQQSNVSYDSSKMFICPNTNCIVPQKM